MSRPPTVAEPILDGEALLFKRPDSAKYQVRFKVKGKWYVRSTNEKDRRQAIAVARDLYFTTVYRVRDGLPVVTKTFNSIAQVVLKDLKTQAENTGSTTPTVYIGAFKNYLIPYFGAMSINSIDRSKLLEFDKWRRERAGKELKKSTVKAHNAALQLVFETAVQQKVIDRSSIPDFVVSGEDREKRPTFTLEEYQKLYRFMRVWVKRAPTEHQKNRRLLMRDLVLILANTGMRPGTESDSIKWGAVSEFKQGTKQYLAIRVDGKVGARELICRHSTKAYFDRIRERSTVAIKADTPVIRLPNGKPLSEQPTLFKDLLKDAGLLVCPRTGQDRTLYSLRHFFATIALVYRATPVHTLARQMGTSVVMIEQHYSDLMPRMAAGQIVG